MYEIWRAIFKAKRNNKCLGAFIADTVSPLSFVENPTFKNFVSSLDLKFELPSRKKLSTTHLCKVYTETEHKLNDKLTLGEKIA